MKQAMHDALLSAAILAALAYVTIWSRSMKQALYDALLSAAILSALSYVLTQWWFA
jgi:hypothetical protein